MKRLHEEHLYYKLRDVVTELEIKREEQGISRQQLAKKTGIAVSAIRYAETEKTICYTLANIILICEALNVKPSDILKSIDL